MTSRIERSPKDRRKLAPNVWRESLTNTDYFTRDTRRSDRRNSEVTKLREEMLAAILPDPNDERELSTEWLKERIRQWAETLKDTQT